MAQWMHMTQILQHLPYETVSSLYPPNTFPIEVRHYISEWIENQRWEDFSQEKVEQENQAQILLDQGISMMQSVAQQNANVVEKMKLMQMSRHMELFHQQPLKFALMVRDILRQERALINGTSPAQYPAYPTNDISKQDVDQLVLKVLEVQEIRKKMHQIQEELNWERQNFESAHSQGSFQQNGLDSANAEIKKLQTHIQQLEYNIQAMATKRSQLLKESMELLGICQNRFLNRLNEWRWEQRKAAIGFPFDDNLSPLQTWAEQLLGMNGNLRQELMLTGELTSELQEGLSQLVQVLIESSLIVDKQPPQVIKTQSKFSTTVRYLLGEKVAPGKPVLVKAQIINEIQARNLANVHGDNVGELINNSAVLEHNAATKSTCSNFRNMSIKKIKRADRKGSESVTEEKFALLFSSEINITGCETPYRIQVISQPVVVIVHGSQDNNAVATIIWDCAFSERDRVPFVVPDRVPWRMMYNTLNSKFTSEVGTQHNLDQYNQHFLAQKVFDKPDFNEDFSNMMVSWAQFNKEVLPGRPFTFWQWFEGVMELTKKHLKTYWSEGLIFGFIGKQHLHLILKDRPNGTFLLRFSDSEIGGITIAYVSATENGGQKIQNIQPFTKRDLEIRGLGDRIRDIDHITYLYPEFPKHDVFRKFYTAEPTLSTNAGYIPVSLQLKVGMDAQRPTSSTPLSFNMDTMPSPHSSFNVESIAPTPIVQGPETSQSSFSMRQFQSPFNSPEFPDEIIDGATTAPGMEPMLPDLNFFD